MAITDPDYTPPIETTFDVEKPIRSDQGLLLAGNPIAIALGKPGAPRVLGQALGLQTNFFAASAGPHVVTIPSQATQFEILAIAQDDIAAGYELSFAFSDDGGSTWGSTQFMFNTVGTSRGLTQVFFDLTVPQYHRFGHSYDSGGVFQDAGAINVGLSTYVANANRFRIGFRGSQYAQLMVRCVGGEAS